MIRELRQSHRINKIYNFRKELKHIKKQKNRQIQQIKNMNIEDSTFIGTSRGKRPIYTPDDAKHICVCGTTGSGKTVALSNYIRTAVDKDYPLLIVDGKGDSGEGSIYDIVKRLKGNKKLYVINLNNPLKSDFYNPFYNASPTICKDMLINMTEWTEPHYKFNSERYLQRLIQIMALADMKLTFKNIIKHMDLDNFLALNANLLKAGKITKDEHMANIALAKSCGKIAQDSIARFSLLAESELGYIFDDTGIDVYTAIKENAIILFILNPLIFPEISPLVGRLILIDSKKALSKLYGENEKRIFFMFDEINSYASPTLIDLVNKSRSAKITCILSMQSLSDLDYAAGEAFKQQVIENCNNYIIMRQNSAVNAEHWANILCTRKTMEVTYQLEQKGLNTSTTGFGSAKRVREFYYHPDDIKMLKTGEAILLSKDSGFHSKIMIFKPF